MPLSAPAAADLHRRAAARLRALCDALPDEAFFWTPTPAAWSVAECVEHLNRSAEGWLGTIEPAVEARARPGSPPARYGLVTRRLLEAVAPGGPAVRTGRALDPSAGGARPETDRAATRAALRAAFDGYAARFVRACERADGLDLGRTRVRYPFGPLLRLPLGAALELTALHVQRHAAQAERVAARPDAPS